MIFIIENKEVVNKKIKQGLAVAEEYNWDKTADLLWETIVQTYKRDSPSAIPT